MPAGQRTTYATLRKIPPGDNEPTYEPPDCWIWIRPGAPTSFDEDHVTHFVETDYHPQMTTDAALELEDGRLLYVRGIVDVENRHVTHQLLCEEVLAR